MQTVQWFDKDVTIEKAETRTEVRESWLGNVSIERGHMITVTIQNRTRFGTDMGSQHWDLFLADGIRREGKTDRADFGPQDALSFEFWFEDESAQTLEGAYLELNGTSYGTFKPPILPLDAPIEAETALRLTELEGLVFEGESEDKPYWRHEIVSARVSLSSEAHDGFSEGFRAEVGKKLVDLVVRTTAVNDATNLFDDDYHLLADDAGVSPVTNLLELPKVGELVELPIVFQIDESAMEFDLEFDVQQGRGSTWSTVHVDLTSATPAK